jgi:hypothetical protein
MRNISLIPPTDVLLSAMAPGACSRVIGGVHLDGDASSVVEVRAERLAGSFPIHSGPRSE